MNFLILTFFALCVVSCQQADKVEQYVVDIDSPEGLWDISDWECYKNEKLTESTFEYIKPGTMPVKNQQFLDLIFYSSGKCRQLYRVSALTPNDVAEYLYSELNWSFDVTTNQITLTNSAIDGSFATTKLKILHFNDGEFILEGLQPTVEDCEHTYYRLYGKVGSSEDLAEAERLYANDKE